jgi:molybdopterin/thiamine biosynthesis adenylyltransferase
VKTPACKQEPAAAADRERDPFGPASARLVVVGAGGAIGAPFIRHVAREPGVGEVVVIDPDRYEPSNLRGQDIEPSDVGCLKARAMEARLRRINPTLEVKAIPARVEDVPLGVLRADVVVTCLDSRAARCYVNRAVRRLGLPWWIDGGVERDGLLARVNVYRIPDSPCMECGWGDADYESVEQARPCLGGDATPAPTNAPSALGGLAAAHEALELRKILAGAWELVAAGREVTVSCAFHRHLVTSRRHDPNCRCPHDAWDIRAIDASPEEISLGEALELGPRGGGDGAPGLAVERKPFVRAMHCPTCGWRRELIRLEGRLTGRQRSCAKCGDPMTVVGFESLDRLSADVLPPSALTRPLSRLGFLPGDIFSVARGGRETHVEIGASP